VSKRWAICVARQLSESAHVKNVRLKLISQRSTNSQQKYLKEKCEMKDLLELTDVPGVENSRAAHMGRKLVMVGLSMKALPGVLPILVMLALSVVSASAQTPTGSFFNGNSSQLGNSLRSVTFFLAAAMIIAGIIFIAYGIITSGLKESLSTWKFITGAACFAFGGVCAAIYAFSQGDTVPLDNQF
jgi:hypothetical protein